MPSIKRTPPIATKLWLLNIAIITSALLSVLMTYEMKKGATLHQLNIQHLKYNQAFFKDVINFQNNTLTDTQYIKQHINDVRAQPVACLEKINALEIMFMRAIATDNALDICKEDIALADDVLEKITLYEQGAIHKNELVKALVNAQHGFQQNSEDFDPLVSKTVYLLFAFIILITIITAIIVILVGIYLSRAVARNYKELAKTDTHINRQNTYLNMAEKVAELGHWTIDVTDNSLHWSKEVYHLHGLSPEDPPPNVATAIGFYHPDDQEHVKHVVTQAIEKKESFEFEMRLIRNDGELRYVYSKGECQINEEGTLTAVFGIIQDITERKLADAALKESQAFLELIMDNNPDVIFVKDQDFRIVQANSAFLSLHPREQRDSIIGSYSAENYDKKQAEEFLKHDRIAFEHGYSETVETIAFPDGNTRTLYTLKIRFESTEGEPFVLGIGRDISELRHAEENLASVGRVVEESLNEVYIFDAYTLKFIQVNRGARQNIGYSMNELRSMTPLDIKPEFTEVNFSKLIKPLREKDREDIIFESIHQRKDGSFYHVSANLQTSTHQGQKVFVANINDISERKRAETQQLKLMDQLTRSNTELERFAYVASHDMQEPIRMITNFSQILASSYSDILDDEGKEYLSLLTESSARMRAMIDDLLEYARIGHEHIVLSEIDGNKELEHILESLGPLINEHKAQITFDALPTFQGNPVQFTSLMQNLITNGIKYQAPSNIPEIHVSVEDREAFWHFSVKDNGIGIKKEYIEQIFEPFKRLHGRNIYTGTGLGLAVCQRIVENHDGKIWVSSSINIGSVFHFTISKHLSEGGQE